MALLENNNILLRALEPEDLDILYKWENDSSLWQYGVTITPYSKFALREYLSCSTQGIFQSHQLRLMMIEKASGHTIGTIDLYDFDPMNRRAGVGILLDPDYRRKGFGFQALQLIKEYAFRFLSLKQLYAYVPKTNLQSYKLFQKSGYEESGLLKSWTKTEEGFADVYLMQQLSSEKKPA
ncbi:MAG: GNAT family N-acetyltransferase [Candidatus Symbiothrix sp.]|jgi:diamine N-acetyltransferase|nr:GNAT family N-acetyltransferase [Candidatus Symbiothrix sp.]